MCGATALIILVTVLLTFAGTNMSDHQQQHHQGHHLPQTVPGPPPYSTLVSRKQQKMETATRSRSRSPHTNSSGHQSPPLKKTHTISGSESDGEHHMDINDRTEFPELTKPFSFILTHYDSKYENPKLLLQQLTKYVSRNIIVRIIPTRNGMIIHTTDANLASKIRNKHSFEIFGKTATMSRLEQKQTRQPPPPRKTPTLSVVIRGIDPSVPDNEIETELKEEGHSIHKCLRIKNKTGGPTYMVRVLTTNQETIDDLLHHGAYIYKRRYRVEPSHSPPPLPIRCERCQQYNVHHTANCTNENKCGYCSGPHPTRSCTNMQNPPKCTTCSEAHPTFSYKCKARPAPEPTKPEFTVPIRTPETANKDNITVTSVYQPVNIDQLLAFITVTLQNIHPFQRHFILQQIQHAAKTTFHVNFNATYSGPYAHFNAHALETEV